MRTLLLGPLLLALTPLATTAQPCVSKPDLGTLTGTVLDDSTSLPLRDADVTVAWRRAGEQRMTRRETESEDDGRFTICDVGTGVLVYVSAKFGGRDSRSASTQLEPGGADDLRLLVDAPRSRVVGRVIDDASSQPIAAASVTLGADGPTAVSGDDGRFLFAGVPPGRHAVRVTHVAFTAVSDSMIVELGAITNVNVRMATNVIPLAPIEVDVRSMALERAGFYERQARGSGSYITRREIEAIVPHLSSDVLRRQAGLRMVQRRSGFGWEVVGRGNCPFRYFVDGTRVGPTFQIDDMPPNWIEAIEIYRGPGTVPSIFKLPPSAEHANCGIIAVWTRSR